MGNTLLKDIIAVTKELNSKCFKNIEDLNLNKELEISTDSRDNFDENKLFLAIKGEKFDGNKFALETYNKGCRYFILSDASIKLPDDAVVFYADDTILFFIKLAREYRRRFNIPVISITGSCGKTTTKELTHLFLSTKYKALKTEGNLNNEIGVPKTIFNLDDSYEIAVIEAGMNHENELLRISEAIEANTVIINNVEPVHIAYLGSIENIAYAKSELFNHTRENANAVINKNTNCIDILEKEASRNNIKNIIEADIKEIIKKDDNTFEYNGITFKHNLIGDFNLHNVLSALKAAELYDVDLQKCADILITYESQKNRMQIINIKGCNVINDCYNSNPAALKNMIKFLSQRSESKKIAVIGDMLETETENSSYHKDIGKIINELKNIDTVIAVGKHSKDIYDTVNCEKYYFENAQSSVEKVKEFLKYDTAMLIKASLGMGFAVIIDSIKNI
ncbi:UDP-N-acetylmuramoylalanyl-D-glutamyl-2, 6-diaminopimelate--D-alanyl-D-alanine ligase [Brachyspira hyodysenteriae]|uniref:UDP-N-acetylmuramoyl-tripeptide--D-alanyl-D-alanine ligase n=1 Tax=Brachyspira hyodysenteriae (strain ATCC 49526 / WA1) TaxID=565034 RepID=A0A3B6V9W4_BRAHW|nr:UDP-N-acetylmuramoyl-tripeptide--D-alanyl-D-alanine ligase [Brachyspira hyodysenteriae]ACN83230.1 UDP-N-acetylmuramoylalanyl-D-glutamyl-2, 6-diaminopimelate--D-alanyl-D-alanyl ligase [Brachyspira hyodysenteriae WA1]KLI48489.1 UDP-N-acetylmuramoylalanyl-D-glutamyl-2, 6-diaminopimelate--D-alanyl-D-alanine ligase [Brachyspira hyodysenteriae]KLI56387.1 UDP-N-acetylmuramoylalanyl-D-glutamyl-2, 6-diaminopimelate--D-alanyl-D-alanine ligase [Brachyspira hyodysenteriae]